VLILSVILFVAFNHSANLWDLLATIGLRFQGDPHVGRFVSIYFDPNFYAGIAIIPLILSIYLYKITNHKKYFVTAVLFICSIILTGSRSGFATLIFFLIYLLILWRGQIKRSTIKYVIFIAILSIGILPLLIE
jgi:hypothetical protein